MQGRLEVKNGNIVIAFKDGTMFEPNDCLFVLENIENKPKEKPYYIVDQAVINQLDDSYPFESIKLIMSRYKSIEGLLALLDDAHRQERIEKLIPKCKEILDKKYFSEIEFDTKLNELLGSDLFKYKSLMKSLSHKETETYLTVRLDGISTVDCTYP